MTKVSIIIPVYNTEKYIKKCLDSILSQTMTDYEIILVDDRSTDCSYDIMRSYEKNYPSIIKVIRNEQNSGAGKSRNAGLSIANGDYVSFIDSDDYISKDMIEKLYLGCKENNAEISRVNIQRMYKGIGLNVLGRNVNFTSNQIINPSNQPEYISKETPVCTNKMFNHQFIGNAKFPENLKWEDLPFTIPLLAKASSIALIADTNYFYNINPKGITCSDSKKLSPRMLDIFDCADIIERECITAETAPLLREQLQFIQIQNCIQRFRDILFSNCSVKDKKEIATLLSQLIDKKYGPWQENELYQNYKQFNPLYNLRMDIVEKFLIGDYNHSLSENEIRAKIKEKIKGSN